jgi:hypothetical protein
VHSARPLNHTVMALHRRRQQTNGVERTRTEMRQPRSCACMWVHMLAYYYCWAVKHCTSSLPSSSTRQAVAPAATTQRSVAAAGAPWLMQRGMHFLGKSFEGTYAYDSPEAVESLRQMAAAGVTHVSLTFCWYVNVSTQRPPHSPGGDSPPPAPPCLIGQRLYNYSNTRPWSGLNGNPHGHENNAHVQLIGKTDTADACERACKASPSQNCTSWIWHNHDGSDWDGHCSRRSDGEWMPVPTKNDVSGRVNDTVYPPPPTPADHKALRWSTKVSFVDGVAPSGVIYANSSSPSDDELTTIIAAAHELNLTVKLRPTIDPRWESVPGCTERTATSCPSRGAIHFSTPTEWSTFFEEGSGGYTDYILHMAALAERTNCSILAVGVENGAVMAQETHMRTLIAKVRKVFSGQLHSDIAGSHTADFGLDSVKFWDAVDAISLDSYPNLKNSLTKSGDMNPTVEELMGGFQEYIDGMERFYNGTIGGNGSWTPKQAGLQIIWAEDGGCSYQGTYLHPGAFYHPAKPDQPCLSCQANYYEATLRTLFCNKQLRPWFGGVYWWKWSTDPDPWSHPEEGTPYNHASGNNSDCKTSSSLLAFSTSLVPNSRQADNDGGCSYLTY